MKVHIFEYFTGQQLRGGISEQPYEENQMNKHERLVAARDELRAHIEQAARAAGMNRDIRYGCPSHEVLTHDTLTELQKELGCAQAALQRYLQELAT